MQVAHFYNTIDQQMIPSQQSMMLDSALSFERLVKNPKTGSKESGGKTQVTWDNPPELEAYIDKLQAAADKLTSENRRLRKCHYNISDKVHLLVFTFYGRYTLYVADKHSHFMASSMGSTVIKDFLACIF